MIRMGEQMLTLERMLADIIALRDSDAVRNLCLDCWRHAQTHGEPAGQLMAENLRDGVLRYIGHELAIRGARSEAGVVLGEKPVPFKQAIWIVLGRRMKRSVRIDMEFIDVGKTIYAEDMVIAWCEPGGAGWWRVPADRRD